MKGDLSRLGGQRSVWATVIDYQPGYEPGYLRSDGPGTASQSKNRKYMDSSGSWSPMHAGPQKLCGYY
jgi:hypothetical protein